MGLWKGSKESLDKYMGVLKNPQESKFYPEWKGNSAHNTDTKVELGKLLASPKERAILDKDNKPVEPKTPHEEHLEKLALSEVLGEMYGTYLTGSNSCEFRLKSEVKDLKGLVEDFKLNEVNEFEIGIGGFATIFEDEEKHRLHDLFKDSNTSFKTNRAEKVRVIKSFFESTKLGQELGSLGYEFDSCGCDDIRAPYNGYFRVKKV